MGQSVGGNYKDCRLEILDDENVKYSDDYEGKAVGRVLPDELTRDTVERFIDWVENYGDPNLEQRCKKEDLQILGLHLYNLLFDRESREDPETKEFGSVRKSFEKAVTLFEKDRKNYSDLRLRVILTFHKAADQLAAYPWEFIRMPWKPDSFFLAGKKTELILTRCIPETGVNDKLDPEIRPLRILIACSHPKELGIVGAEDMVSKIKKLSKKGMIEVESVDVPTYKNLETKLNDLNWKPHIFHFIGHGKEGEVALKRERKSIEDEEKLLTAAEKRAGKIVKEAAWTKSNVFAELFKNHPPRLVFLHACKGAATGPSYNLRSTALELVYAKIPAVVAMQYEISNDDADIFSAKFYQHIDEGKSVDEAVSEGRWELGTFRTARDAWSDRGFGNPVIYLQGNGPVISPQPPDKSLGDSGSEESTAPAKVRCPYPDDQKGLVIPGKKYCSECHRPIMLCPTCNQVMVPGFCDTCGPGIASSFDVKTEESTRARESFLQATGSQKAMESLPTRDDTKTGWSPIDARAESTQ